MIKVTVDFGGYDLAKMRENARATLNRMQYEALITRNNEALADVSALWSDERKTSALPPIEVNILANSIPPELADEYLNDLDERINEAIKRWHHWLPK